MHLSSLYTLPGVARTITWAEQRLLRRRHHDLMTVAFAINRTFVRPLGTTLLSLLKNNPGPIEVVILSADLGAQDSESIRPLEALRARFPELSLRFIAVDTKRFDRLDTNADLSHISRETYFRYLLPEVLPDRKRVLYLDADLLICASLKTLWETPMGEAYVAGVRDVPLTKLGHPTTVGIAAHEPYINAGVLLFNLEAMRRDNLTERLLHLSAERTLPFMDQDALNLACRKRIHLLPAAYNLHADLLGTALGLFRGRPSILHFTGALKPWQTHLPAGAWHYRIYERDWERIAGLQPICRVGLLVDDGTEALPPTLDANLSSRFPNRTVQIDLLLNADHPKRKAVLLRKGGRLHILLPRTAAARCRFLRQTRYEAYVSFTRADHKVLRDDPRTPHLLLEM